jgi:hypothetical protein
MLAPWFENDVCAFENALSSDRKSSIIHCPKQMINTTKQSNGLRDGGVVDIWIIIACDPCLGTRVIGCR